MALSLVLTQNLTFESVRVVVQCHSMPPPRVTYLRQAGYQSQQHLSLTIAQEAVGIQLVILAIETQRHVISRVLRRLSCDESDLGGSPA